MAPTFADANRLRSLGIELRDSLVRAKRAIDEEIRTYPTPIPRCDAQFNHMYEQRSRLAEVLNRLHAALDREDGTVELLSAMTEFASLHSMDETAEERSLRARITTELSRGDAPRGAEPSRDAGGSASGVR
jgi:hypothetical protein